jgi:hypothetical protein
VKGEPVESQSPVRSNPFSRDSLEALAKVGTVKLPHPHPASGRLYIGINPDSNPDSNPNLPAGPPKFFLRLVQTVSTKQVVTRIVDLKELRGISLPATSTEKGKTSRKFHTVNDREIADQIREKTSSLMLAERTESGVYEVVLFEDAIILVPESAPTVVQIQFEFGVTAAEAAEHVDLLVNPLRGGCKCGTISPLLDDQGL